MTHLTAAERSQALLLGCLEKLESFMVRARAQTVSPEDMPEWDNLFGAKETVVGILHKLVSMQKTVQELKAREEEGKPTETMEPMTEEDWELLALCVDRWRERKASEG